MLETPGEEDEQPANNKAASGQLCNPGNGERGDLQSKIIAIAINTMSA